MARGGRILAGIAVLVLTAGCVSQPPPHPPSSVRILLSRTTRDSLGTRTDIHFLVARSGNELQLTGELGEDRQPVFAERLRRVFFTRGIEGHDEIWSVALDGSGEQAVLSSPEAAWRDPAVSPDGTLLAVTREVGGRREVWLTGADGSDPRPLLADGGPWREPAWSPDGRTIAATGGPAGALRIHLVPVTGGASRPLAPAEPAPQSEPAWSPDGTRIAFVRGAGEQAEIAVADVATGRVTRLTDNRVPDASPAWSPDGGRIAFVSRRPGARENIWLMDADGRNAEPLTRHERDDARDPNWL